MKTKLTNKDSTKIIDLEVDHLPFDILSQKVFKEIYQLYFNTDFQI